MNPLRMLWVMAVAFVVSQFSHVYAQLTAPTLTVTNYPLAQDFMDTGATVINWGMVAVIAVVTVLLIVGIVLLVRRWMAGRR